jgi:hypothetical protein
MRLSRLLLLAPAVALAQAQAPAPAPADEPANPLVRKYVENETVEYDMRATHQARTGSFAYGARASGTVIRAPEGGFFEEFQWSNLTVDGAYVELPLLSRLFRERVSLAPDAAVRMPALGQLHYRLVAPVLDLQKIYADLALAARLTDLTRTGDNVKIPHNRTYSWADGRVILVGENANDFDMTLQEVSSQGKTATVIVRHVPPEAPAIQLAADWMRKPVAAGANNWVQIANFAPGKYTASVGSERIEVRVVVALVTGRILSATLDNTVEILERECDDVDAKRCGEPARYRIIRSIELLPARDSLTDGAPRTPLPVERVPIRASP